MAALSIGYWVGDQFFGKFFIRGHLKGRALFSEEQFQNLSHLAQNSTQAETIVSSG